MSAPIHAEPPPVPAQPLRPDAFVSYARTDKAFVARLVEALEGRGKDVFIDHDDIRKGEDWWKRILVGIGSSKCVVVVLSPRFAKSETCAKETARAVDQHKRLVPIVCRDVELSELPEAITALDFVFARDEDDFDAAIDQLVDAIELDVAWLDAHARLTVRATEWIRGDRDSSLLLRRSDLAAAEQRLAEQGSHAERLTDDQVEYILASREAERRRRRVTLGAVTFALVVAVVLAVLAWLARSEAIRQSAESRSREYATVSADRIAADPELGLLVALEAERSARTPEAIAAIRRALASSHVRLRLKPPPGAAVERVSAAADDRRLVASDEDSTTLADARTGREVERLPGRAAATSQGGSRVITADADGAHVFDAETGRPLATLTAPGLVIDAAVPTGGDEWVAAAAQTHGGRPRAVVWRSSDHDPVAIFRGTLAAASPSEPVVAVTAATRLRLVRLTPERSREIVAINGPAGPLGAAFDPSGRRFAALSDAGDLILWNLRTGHGRSVPLYSPDAILPGFHVAFAFNRSGSRLAIAPRPNFSESGGGSTVGGSSTAIVVDARDGHQIAELTGHGSLLDGIAFAPNGRRLVTCSDDGTARVWDIAGDPQVVLRGHDGPVLSCAFVSPDRVMTGGSDKSARVWDVSSLRPVRHAVGGAASVGEGGRVIALADKTGSTRVLDAVSGAELASFRRPAVDDIDNLRVDERGRTLAVNPTIDDDTTIWSVHDGRRIAALKGRTLALSQDGNHALVDRYDRGTLLDLDDPNVEVPVKWGVSSPVTAMFSPDGKVVITLDGDASTASGYTPPRVWDTRTGALLRTLGHEQRAYAGAFTPDGRYFATGGEAGVIRIWAVQTGRQVAQLPNRLDRVLALAYDRTGTSLVAAVRGNHAFVWDVDAPATPLPLSHPDDVVDAAFSPDGTFVVTSTDGGDARVWDRLSGRLLMDLPRLTGGIVSARFTADSRSVMVSSSPELAVVVSTYACDVCRAPDDLVAVARSRTTRALTASERRTYLHQG